MKKPTLFRMICSCLAAVLYITAFALFAASFIHFDIVVGTADYSGFQVAFDFTHDITANGSNAGTFVAWLLLLLAMIGCTMGALLELFTYSGTVKAGNVKITKKQALISEASSFVVAATIAILIFCTIPMTGYTGSIASKVASLGVGAILSGIFTLLAAMVGACGNLYEFFVKKK